MYLYQLIRLISMNWKKIEKISCGVFGQTANRNHDLAADRGCQSLSCMGP